MDDGDRSRTESGVGLAHFRVVLGSRLALFDENDKLKNEKVVFFVAPD